MTPEAIRSTSPLLPGNIPGRGVALPKKTDETPVQDDGYVGGTRLKEPRTEDMRLYVEAVREHQAALGLATPEPPTRPLKEPISEDMRLYVDAVQDHLAEIRDHSGRAVQAANIPSANSVPVALVTLDETPAPAHPHAEPHGSSAENGLTGGYIGASAAKTELAQAAEPAAQATAIKTEGVGQAADLAGAKAEALLHGARLPGHGAVEAKTQAAQHAADAKAQAIQSGTDANGAIAHSLAETTGLVTAGIVGGAIGCAAVGVGMTIVGAKHLRHGIKDHNKEQMLEGTGALILGAKSNLAALSLGGTLAHGGALATAAHVAHAALAPLGVIHGAIDTVVGTKRIIDGVKTGDRSKVVSGGLSIGVGVSLAAAAVTGGLPALVVAGAFLGGKVLYQHLQNRKERAVDEALAKAQQPPVPPQPQELKKSGLSSSTAP